MIGCAVLLAATTSVSGVPDDERYISFYNIHTKEKLDVVYKRNGRYVASAMKKINHIMRDWRLDKSRIMDPKLIDLVWELHTQLGSQKRIHLISGYRSSKTNEKLRRKGGGQAKKSRHILGMAADIHFPDITAKQLRNSALIRERGGVGYYPTSAIPFVHVDTGRVRNWPRLPRLELASLFPNGKTKHRPRSGGPITMRDHINAMKKLDKHQKYLIRVARGEIKPKHQGPLAFQIAAVKGIKPTTLAAASAKPAAAPRQLVVASADRLALTRIIEDSTPQERPVMLPPAPEPARAVMAKALPTPTSDAKEIQRSRLILASANSMTDLIERSIFASLAEEGPAIGEVAPSQEASTPEEAAPAPEGWARAPDYDDEHDDELAYQPFPILPLMGDLNAGEGGYFAKMSPPEHADIVALMEDKEVFRLQFRQGVMFAQMLWANEFKGLAVADMAALLGRSSSPIRTASKP